MSRIARILGVGLMLAAFAAVAGGAAVWSGMLNVAASEPHWPIVHSVLETARIRSIKVRAAGVVAPADFASPTRVIGGTSHFAEHCAGCHTAPGVPAEDMAAGMYPKPPVLTDAARLWSPGELFWILQNGIKMSGMPSWADHGEEALWDIVAFIQRLPSMTEQEYGGLVMAAMQASGHHTHGVGEPEKP